MERWNDVESILRAVLTRAPDERATFVEQACVDDSELRREVESLLARETATNVHPRVGPRVAVRAYLTF